jgi:hypothetical protein
MSGSNPVTARVPGTSPIIAPPPGNLGGAAAAASWQAAVCPAPRRPGPSRFWMTAHRSAQPEVP